MGIKKRRKARMTSNRAMAERERASMAAFKSITDAPPRPRVKEPEYWSEEVALIVNQAYRNALIRMSECTCDTCIGALIEDIGNVRVIKVLYYNIASALIDEARWPDGARFTGLQLDQARLLMWIQMFPEESEKQKREFESQVTVLRMGQASKVKDEYWDRPTKPVKSNPVDFSNMSTGKMALLAAAIGAGSALILAYLSNSARAKMAAAADTVKEVGKDAIEVITQEPHTLVSVFGAVTPPGPIHATDTSTADLAETLTAYKKRLGSGFTYLIEGPFAGESLNMKLDAARTPVAGKIAPKMVLTVGTKDQIDGYVVVPNTTTKSGLDESVAVDVFEIWMTGPAPCSSDGKEISSGHEPLLLSKFPSKDVTMAKANNAMLALRDEYDKSISAEYWFMLDLRLRDKSGKVMYAGHMGRKCGKKLVSHA